MAGACFGYSPATPIIMHPTPLSSRLFVSGVLLLLFTACATTPEAPEVTAEGLTKVAHSRADLVYVRSGVSFAGYKKVMLFEPTIAFRKHWQTDIQMETPARPVTDADMAKMIAMGKKLLIEAFNRELTKAGYTLVLEPGPDVLAVRPAIMDLDVYAPDPNKELLTSFNKTYTDGAGSATLAIELYDSVTSQLLARAYDQRSGEDNSRSWGVQRNQQTNIQDASFAMSEWARMFVKGLERAKEAKAP